MTRFYDLPTDMGPDGAGRPGPTAGEMGWEVVRRAERLGAGLHPLTAAGLAGVVQVMNSYHSHLIEGHGTRPADLEAVLRGRGEAYPPARSCSNFILRTWRRSNPMKERLAADPAAPITSEAFLQALHRDFYEALPETARFVAGQDEVAHPVVAGEWRRFPVTVGRHLAPAWEKLPAFMARFAKVYAPHLGDGGASLVACAAAHHRLVSNSPLGGWQWPGGTSVQSGMADPRAGGCAWTMVGIPRAGAPLGGLSGAPRECGCEAA